MGGNPSSLASAPGHDWRGDVVSVFGQRLNALRYLVAESQSQMRCDDCEAQEGSEDW